MDTMNEELIKRIEQALEIKLYDWQVDYILNRPQILNMRITGRCTGKTLAYIIKKLFEEGKPIRAYIFQEVEVESDWWSVTNRIDRKRPEYTHFFKAEIKRIYEALVSKKIQPRPVFFTRQQEEEYVLMLTLSQHTGIDLSNQPDQTTYIPNSLLHHIYAHIKEDAGTQRAIDAAEHMMLNGIGIEKPTGFNKG